MKIWILCPFAGSPRHGMNYRQFYFAREFVRAGHEVLIVSSSYSHQFLVQPRTEGTYTAERIEGVDYLWIKCPSFRGSADPKRLLNWLVFTLRLRGLPGRAPFRPDAIIVSSPIPYPILPAAGLARRLGAGLVFEVRDLWPLSLVELGSHSERHPFIRFTQWVEDFAYRKADLVVSALPGAFEHMKTRGLPPEKFFWVSNGMDPGDLLPRHGPGEDPSPAAGSDNSDGTGGLDDRNGHAGPASTGSPGSPGGNRPFKVCYAGSFHARAVALTLVEAAASLATARPDVEFILIGKDSGGLHILKERAALLGAKNIRFREAVPRTEMQNVLAEMDLCVAMTKASPLYRFGIALTKLFDYMMAGKPILLASNASGDIVTSSGCGLVVRPEDPAALAEAIVKMADSPPSLLGAMGEAGRKTLLSSYTYPKLAAKYLEALERIPR